MPLADVMTPFLPTISAAVGALIALGGIRYQLSANERVQMTRLKIEKLERIYLLCQMVCEGHSREINNAKKHLPARPDQYLELRQHPGMEMSELKMLIRSYLPSLSPSLQLIDSGHKPLKEAFHTITQQIITGASLAGTDFKVQFQLWDSHLETVFRGADEIKGGVARQLLALTKST